MWKTHICFCTVCMVFGYDASLFSCCTHASHTHTTTRCTLVVASFGWRCEIDCFVLFRFYVVRSSLAHRAPIWNQRKQHSIHFAYTRTHTRARSLESRFESRFKQTHRHGHMNAHQLSERQNGSQASVCEQKEGKKIVNGIQHIVVFVLLSTCIFRAKREKETSDNTHALEFGQQRQHRRIDTFGVK